MAINKPKLPPKIGYVEKENAETGNRYYEKVTTLSGYSTETITISKSEKFTIPKSKDQLFQIELIGGGASYDGFKNGSNGKIEAKELALNEGEEVYISIGQAGKDGSNGGTTSFGEYFSAIGGSSELDSSAESINDIYGKGGTEDNSATDGVCIVTYLAPVYL